MYTLYPERSYYRMSKCINKRHTLTKEIKQPFLTYNKSEADDLEIIWSKIWKIYLYESYRVQIFVANWVFAYYDQFLLQPKCFFKIRQNRMYVGKCLRTDVNHTKYTFLTFYNDINLVQVYLYLSMHVSERRFFYFVF